MTVFVNNTSIQLKPDDRIAELFRLINLPEPTGIAVAINNEVIPKSNWEKFIINENDRITLIRATQGG